MLGSCRTQVLGAVLVVSAAWGCGDETFACRSDANCVDAGMNGVCQLDGWCSFPDDTCPSGQRYGQLAGDGKAGSCVPEGESVGTGEGTTTSSSMSASGAMSTGASTSTTMSVEVGPSSDPTTSDATTMSSLSMDTGPDPTTTASGSTTEGPPLDCVLFDEFEGAMIDEMIWEWWAEDAVVVETVDGVLRMTLDATTGAMGGIRTELGDIDGFSVELEVGTIPNQAVGTEQTLILADANGVDVRLTLSGDDVILTSWDGASNEVLYGAATPVGPGWRFRLGFEAMSMIGEQRDGNGGWETFFEDASPIDTTNVLLVARALTFTATMDPGVAEFDTISVCANR